MWESKSYDHSYFNSIIDMSIDNYGPDNDICDPAFLKHQYFDNPAGDALIELAIDPNNGRLAGQYVVQPQNIRIFGENKKCVLSLNTLTHEKYRGQKIFVKLAEKTYKRAETEGYEFVYGAPNPNSYHGFMSDLCFRDIHHFPLYARPLNLNHMVKERIKSNLIATIASPFQVLFLNNANNEGVIEININNVSLMDSFWEKIKDKYKVIGVRNAEYIRYRYLDVPRRKYYPLAVVVDGNIVAYAIGRIREVAGFNAGMIADFLFLPGFEKEAKKLIKVLIKKMKDEGASLAGCIILKNTEEAKIIRKCGLYRIPNFILPQPTPLVLRVLNKDANEKTLSDINNWFFTTGDYDVV